MQGLPCRAEQRRDGTLDKISGRWLERGAQRTFAALTGPEENAPEQTPAHPVRAPFDPSPTHRRLRMKQSVAIAS